MEQGFVMHNTFQHLHLGKRERMNALYREIFYVQFTGMIEQKFSCFLSPLILMDESLLLKVIGVKYLVN